MFQRNFRKCGIYLALFPLVLGLLCITGCIESGTNIAGSTPLQAVEKSGQISLDVDFTPEVSDDLFSTEGSIVLWSNATLPYIMIDAMLQNGSRRIDDAKYMVMNVEPSKGQHFEISKNRKLPQGIYNCTLEISGPEGLIESETRKCISKFAGINKGQEIQYIFLSQGVEEPHVLSDDSLKSYLSRQAPNNLTQIQGQSSKPQVSLSEFVNGSTGAAGELAGSITSKKYHKPSCAYAMKIKPENKIYFASAEEAQRQGYQPCKACNP